MLRSRLPQRRAGSPVSCRPGAGADPRHGFLAIAAAGALSQDRDFRPRDFRGARDRDPSPSLGCAGAAAHSPPPPPRDAATPCSPVKQPWRERIFQFFHIFGALSEDLDATEFLEQAGAPAAASLGGTEALPTPSPGTARSPHPGGGVTSLLAVCNLINRSAENNSDLQNQISPTLKKPIFNMKLEPSNLVSYQIITVVFKLLLILVKQSQIRARGSRLSRYHILAINIYKAGGIFIFFFKREF